MSLMSGRQPRLQVHATSDDSTSLTHAHSDGYPLPIPELSSDVTDGDVLNLDIGVAG